MVVIKNLLTIEIFSEGLGTSLSSRKHPIDMNLKESRRKIPYFFLLKLQYSDNNSSRLP